MLTNKPVKGLVVVVVVAVFALTSCDPTPSNGALEQRSTASMHRARYPSRYTTVNKVSCVGDRRSGWEGYTGVWVGTCTVDGIKYGVSSWTSSPDRGSPSVQVQSPRGLSGDYREGYYPFSSVAPNAFFYSGAKTCDLLKQHAVYGYMRVHRPSSFC